MPLKKSLFRPGSCWPPPSSRDAACATTPPADGQHGAVEFSVELAELDDEGIVVGGARGRLRQSAPSWTTS